MSNQNIIVCTDVEQATIIAALRHYQQQGLAEEANRCEFLNDIATNGGQHDGLEDQEIDELVMSVNFTPEKEEIVQAVKASGLTFGEIITPFQEDESNPYVKAAIEKNEAGEMEVDCPAVVSDGDDRGAYVLAWLWVTDEEAGIPHISEELSVVQSCISAHANELNKLFGDNDSKGDIARLNAEALWLENVLEDYKTEIDQVEAKEMHGVSLPKVRYTHLDKEEVIEPSKALKELLDIGAALSLSSEVKMRLHDFIENHGAILDEAVVELATIN